MRRETTSWYSGNLGMEMPLVAYGDRGYPLLMFPTAAADYLEYERFHLIEAIKPLIDAGKLRAYSINSVNKHSLLNKQASPQWKVELLTRYDRYIMDEVLPLIRSECGDDAKPLTTGASLGAFLAANCYFKHSDAFRGVIAMSGVYDLTEYTRGFWNDDVYFNSPQHYMPNLTDQGVLEQIRRSRHIHIFSGSGAYEAPDAARSFAGILYNKGINYELDIWGSEWRHDWETWRALLPHYLATRF